ncbi:hypothetical protein Tco_0990622 [Tanacetum coccineum]|uniref:Integrase, catalytic region, zinc finger, CCHC-type, peptidase aspartic, catalytic n=1 Tax=Tanacetum coccineum TaxID=301880 RepID=A0ABQ5EXR5_9ASTR
MSSNSDDIQAAGSDTHPPMLDRTNYDSWSQRIQLYCRGKENGIYILQSINHGPFELRTTRDTLGTTPEGVFFLDQKGLALMMILMTMTRNDSMLMFVHPTLCFKVYRKTSTSSSITTLKQKLFGTMSKCFLRDEFESFKMLPGENINEYYVRFYKLVNDKRNIRMTMPNIQLNSKFVNNMSPE